MNSSILNNPVYLINLKHRTDRYDHMMSLLEDKGFTDIRVVRPIIGDDVARQRLIALGFLSPSASLPRNIISHISTYLSIMLNAQEDYFTIMEDDLSIQSIGLSLDTIHNLIPTDFDLFFMEYCYEDCRVEVVSDQRIVDSKAVNLIKKMYSPLCLGAVHYNGASIDKILSNFKNETHQIDHWFKNAINDNRIEAYGTYKPLFVQDKRFGTDLQHKGLFSLSNLIFGTAGRPCKQQGISKVFSLFLVSGLLFSYLKGERR